MAAPTQAETSSSLATFLRQLADAGHDRIQVRDALLGALCGPRTSCLVMHGSILWSGVSSVDAVTPDHRAAAELLADLMPPAPAPGVA